MKKLVSVIIPLYNAANFIESCLISIKNQTYTNLQVIIVNDGSTDDSISIVKNTIVNDSRFIIVNQENKGCSAAKNKGLQYAKGDFIQYLDADDILSENKIELQVLALDIHVDSIAVCRTHVFSNKISDALYSLDEDLISKGGSGLKFLLRLLGSEGIIGMVQPNAYLVPMHIIEKAGPWDESISKSPAEDGEYFTRILLSTKQVLFTEGINYYRKIASISSVSKASKYENAYDLFITIKKSFSHLFAISRSEKFLYLYAVHLTACAYQFGNKYPVIYKYVEQELKYYKIKNYQFIHTTRFSKWTNLFGFRNAMRLKKIYNKVSHVIHNN